MKIKAATKVVKGKKNGNVKDGGGVKKFQWKAKKKLEKKKKQGLVISTVNSSQNWKKVAKEIKTVQTRYKNDPKKMKKREEKLKERNKVENHEEEEKIDDTNDHIEHSEQVGKII
jgi:hypothetical protein